MGASLDPAPLTLRDLAARPVTDLRAVGDKLQAGLAEMGIENVLDLLEHYPRRYLDRTERAEIHELAIGDEATVDAEVKAIHARRTRDRKRTIVNATVYDGTGLLEIVFFNQGWRERQLRPGTQVSLFGKVESYRGKRQMTNPVVDVLADPDASSEVTGAIVPVYPQSGKSEVHTWQLRRAVASCLQRTEARGFADPLDAELRADHDLVDRGRAYNDIHRPATMTDKIAAAQRLKFDEFLRMQLALVARKRALAAEETGIVHAVDGELVPAFHAALPFPLTDDQAAAIAQIADDMAKPAPMHRLLQGEVGSGKTVVALSALLMAVQGGYQGAFMAPTEVLAEQHDLTMRGLLGELSVVEEGSLLGERPVAVALLTNRTSAAERRRIADGLRAGTIDILVGTHALIYGGVEFANLGVAVIDEQHRFGVEQRDLLRGKGDSPDVLVMTATPIPRTAAMLIYGDLDKTELRHLPAGRSPIETTVIGGGPLERVAVYDLVRAQVAEGRQAYVVCPLVDGSDKLEAKAATEEFERLLHEELADLRLGLLHGQMPAADKEAAIARVPRAPHRRARRHDRHRGGRRRPERDGHGHRGRRPLRAPPAPPAARPHRSRQAQELLLPARGADHAAGRGPHGGDDRIGRRLRAGRARPRHPRRGRGVRRTSGRDERPQARATPAGRGHRVRGARRRRGHARRRPRSRAQRAAARRGHRPPRRRRRLLVQV